MKIIFVLFIIAFTIANLLVKHFGAPGLWISSALLIPFDFVLRCVIHERFSRRTLFVVLLLLTVCAASITWIINYYAKWIAIASVCGLCAAQTFAGAFYQLIKYSKNWFFKVNVSDLIAIVFDSIVFQLIAFSTFNIGITAGQIAIKFGGGLFWYYIIFKKLKLHEKFITRDKRDIQQYSR